MSETATKSVADRVNDIIAEAGFNPENFSFKAFSASNSGEDDNIPSITPESIDVAGVILDLEGKFDIDIPDEMFGSEVDREDAPKIRTVANMVTYIEGKINP